VTFFAYWDRLTAATPGLLDMEATMKISVAAFREAIRRAYAAGVRNHLEDMDQTYRDMSGPTGMPEFLRDLFGGRE